MRTLFDMTHLVVHPALGARAAGGQHSVPGVEVMVERAALVSQCRRSCALGPSDPLIPSLHGVDHPGGAIRPFPLRTFGSAQRHGLDKMILTSKASCVATTPQEVWVMKRILVAYDGGEPGRRALATAIELARGLGALLGVVSVVPVRTGRVPIEPRDDRETHAAELLEAKHLLSEAGITADYLAPAGDPARTIEKLVEEFEYDIVVVGSRGLGPVSRFLQGSVSEHLATHAKATVVIAR
jgi:nucleotide-binding universal stress UspA family protein